MTEELKRIQDEFSGDFNVMRLIMHEPQICTYHELKEVYTLEDFYDMLEMVDVQQALQDDAAATAKRKAEQQKNQKR